MFLFLLVSNITAQLRHKTSYPFTLRLSGAIVGDEPLIYQDIIIAKAIKPQFQTNLNIDCFNNVDVGIYLGYAPLRHLVNVEATVNNGQVIYSSYGQTRSNAIYYGLNANYHLLPLLFNRTNLKFDLFPVISLGLVSISWDDLQTGMLIENSPNFECSVGLGFGYFFSRKVGLFFELSTGELNYDARFQLRSGLSFKF